MSRNRLFEWGWKTPLHVWIWSMFQSCTRNPLAFWSNLDMRLSMFNKNWRGQSRQSAEALSSSWLRSRKIDGDSTGRVARDMSSGNAEITSSLNFLFLISIACEKLVSFSFIIKNKRQNRFCHESTSRGRSVHICTYWRARTYCWNLENIFYFLKALLSLNWDDC